MTVLRPLGRHRPGARQLKSYDIAEERPGTSLAPQSPSPIARDRPTTPKENCHEQGYRTIARQQEPHLTNTPDHRTWPSRFRAIVASATVLVASLALAQVPAASAFAGTQTNASGKFTIWVPDDWEVTVNGKRTSAENDEISLVAGPLNDKTAALTDEDVKDFVGDELNNIRVIGRPSPEAGRLRHPGAGGNRRGRRRSNPYSDRWRSSPMRMAG